MNEPRGYRVEDRGYATPCWVHRGALNHAGYGQVFGCTAHVREWESVHGPVPDGFELDHLCRVRACRNPDHLEVVTHAENMRRAYAVREATSLTVLGRNIRAARRRALRSQSQLGALIGVRPSAISHWESGKCRPSRRNAWLLNVAFVACTMRLAIDGREGQYTTPIGARRAA